MSDLFGVASAVDSRFGDMAKGALDFFEGISLAQDPVSFVKDVLVKAAFEGMAALVSATKEFSTILANAVKESGLVDFESMLYDNVAAANQFGLSAKDTGELLAGLNNGMSGFALMSSDIQNAIVEQSAALNNLGVDAGEAGKLFETLTQGS